MRTKAPAAPRVPRGRVRPIQRPAGKERDTQRATMSGAWHENIGGDGLWRSLRSGPAEGPPHPALFLDRDGTVIEEVPYLSRPDAVRPIPGALAAIARANALDIPVVVVTNQSGIARGLFDWSAYAAVEAAVEAAVDAAGGRIDAVYACPHAPPAVGEPVPPGRKPDPGMLLCAANELNLDLSASWIAGDCASDLEAGRRAGLCRGWLVPTGYGPRNADIAYALAGERFEVVVGQSLDALAAELNTLRAGRG